MKFAHIADCHLGSWRHDELQELNFKSFQKAVDICINEKLDFILIAGDLFDSAYPSIEVLKKTFSEFKKISDAKIPVYLIAGSHDYSVSGKTFLDVLENAGFIKNVFQFEEKDEKKILLPTRHENIAIYGYPGKKSGLEIPELRKISIQDSPGMFKIFMLHTTLDEARGNLPIDSISLNELPKTDYYALGHLHLEFKQKNSIYPGPIFPNNFDELEKLKKGSFYIVESSSLSLDVKKIDLSIKDVLCLGIKITDALSATEKIISEIDKENVEDKIVLLRLSGILEKGKTSDIDFTKIENYLTEKNAYFFLKNTSQLKTPETEIKIEVSDMGKMEEEIIEKHEKSNPHKFNHFIKQLMNALEIDKQEGEKTKIYETRLLSDLNKILDI